MADSSRHHDSHDRLTCWSLQANIVCMITLKKPASHVTVSIAPRRLSIRA